MADKQEPKDSKQSIESNSNVSVNPEAKQEPLALPAPGDAKSEADVVAGGDPLKFDKLGPMVLNTDGTISRITNWDKMTDKEKETTYRIVSAK
mmetsp:Transcript_22160/g.41525  ORF Transcript_22160/g.41525 Transcript_22160/m.41525 type:complete len:93 (-) Transcript_22160:475-753(-)